MVVDTSACVFAIMVSRILVTLSDVSFKKVSWLARGFGLEYVPAWWLRWSFNDNAGYNYFDYLILLAPALALAFTVAVLTPSDEPADWSDFQKSKRVQYFSSYGILWLTLFGSQLYYAGNWKSVVGPIVFCALGAFIKNRYFQYVLLAFLHRFS